MLPTKLWFTWKSGFRGEGFLGINQSETRIARGGHVCSRITTKCAIFIEDLPQMLPTKFQFICPISIRGKYFFRNRPIRSKNCLLRPCLLTDGDKMCNLYRGSTIDVFYQPAVHLAKQFQRIRFFIIDQSEKRIACGSHVCLRIGTKCAIFIEDLPQMLPFKFRFIWPHGFREEDFFKSTNQKQELPVTALFINGSGRNVQSLQRTFHRCFLPSFSSFGKVVLEEKI